MAHSHLVHDLEVVLILVPGPLGLNGNMIGLSFKRPMNIKHAFKISAFLPFRSPFR